MSLDTASLLWGLLFGSIGLGYAIYGKKQRSAVPFVCGLLLMGLPYFIESVVLMVAVCAVVAALPYFFRR
ncbi:MULTISPECIES: hypothetical protein [Pseudomonas]|uniref:hypothetical protein n=1 Tax=Pseudomonas sp. MS19 TaxID=2579939 RepID=UPI000854FF46|nr:MULTISPECIES: hypothetical protein [Pseudomonas]NRH26709.1 hypothetical protein [Pseudomonas sp. MS19]OEO24181.1 hypothetical protein AX279_20395 [Pseudomonas sp. J237]